jgi:tetratricopeptide (TPR) repeat protein
VAILQKRYAYCMGANSPQGFVKLHNLHYAERDAELLAQALKTSPCAFTETKHVIANNHRETLTGLASFIKRSDLQEQDLLVVHFSGHGYLFEGKLYLLCNQTDAPNMDLSAIDIDALKRRLADCPAQHKLLILDCCHSGGATQGILKGVQEIEKELSQAFEGTSNVILAACSRFQRTRELDVIDGEEGGGVLSWIVRKACTTRLNEVSDGRSLSLKDIQRWIPKIVSKINNSLPEGEERLPPPKTFYEGQGVGELWLTEARRYSSGKEQQIADASHLHAIIASQREFVEDRVNRFVGRKVELTALQERIDRKMEGGGYVIITGDAGQGKSSIIAKMIAERGIDTSAYHFVQNTSGDDYRTNLLRKLIARFILKYRLPDYYIGSEIYSTLSGNFSLVLADIAAKGGQEVIYIDGIDQLTTSAITEQGLNFLPAKLPPGIVIVIGTRPNDTLKKQLRAVIGSRDNDPYALGMLSRSDFDLLLRSYDDSLLSPPLVQRFYEAMQGNALYLDLLAQELKVNRTSYPEELIASIESNPNSIFTITFSRMKTLEAEWRDVIRPLLGTLLVAREALTQQQIADICTVESYRIKEGIMRLGGLLTRLGHEKHTLFHRKLYEYLKENPDRPDEEYEFDLGEERQCHRKLASWCGQGTNEYLWSEDADPLDREDYREYSRKHYVTHLHNAREYPRLFELLDYGDYERGKLHADPSTRSTVLDLLLGCEDAAYEVTRLREGVPLVTNLRALVRLWRYTLLRCSLATQADTYPIEAFQALLALGREREALDLAELLTQPMHKLASLTLVMQQLLSQSERIAEGVQLYDRTYEVAESIADSSERVSAFAHLAASLQLANEEAKAKLCWQKADTIVDTITDSNERAKVLYCLMNELKKANMWEKAEKTVKRINSPIEQIDAWGHLSLALRQAGLDLQAETASKEMQMLVNKATGQPELDRAKSIFALALAQEERFEEAKKIASEIRNSVERDATRVRIEAKRAIADADAWEDSWNSIDTILQKYAHSGRVLSQLDDILVSLSVDLAREERWWQARIVALVMPNKESRCRAMMGIVSELACHGQHEQAEDGWIEARALCTAQINMVETSVAGIVVSALVKAGQVTQAKEIANSIPDKNTQEYVMSELAIALASVKQVQDAKTIAESIINLQNKANIQSSIAIALMELEESEQAQTIVASIEDKKRRRYVLDELVTTCCNTKQWEQAQVIANLIDDPTLQAESLEHVISGLVRAKKTKEVEKIISSITNKYLKANVIGNLVTVLVQSGDTEEAKKFFRKIKNDRISKKTECNCLLVGGGIPLMTLEMAEDTAKAIPESNEREEALCNVAIAYARAQLWDEAKKIMGLINDKKKQDEARTALAIELAKDGQWEHAVTTLDAIQKNSNRRLTILQTWGTLLAQSSSREQRENIEQHLNDSREKANFLVSVADTLAQRGQYVDQIHIIQHAWLQANTKDDCLYLFAMIRMLLLQAPEMGASFYEAFAWVGTSLGI